MHTIHRASSEADWMAAAALVHDHVEWIRRWTDFDPLAEQPALAVELDDLAGQYGNGDAAIFLAEWKGLAVGTVAIRCHRDRSAELKRMFVRPFARGRGIGDALVRTAIDAAADQGCRMIWLETVSGAMDTAIAVYARAGFAVGSTRPPTLTIDGVIVMERPLLSAEP